MFIIPSHQSVTKKDNVLVLNNLYYQYIWKVKKFKDKNSRGETNP